jgi:hypothetical protein
MASTIIDLLKAFNRKERYWVIKGALGQETPLSQTFCDQLAQTLGLQPFAARNAWWAMDYHLDWLVAAGEAYRRKIDPKDLGGIALSFTGREAGLTGTQEDVDFVVAHDRDLILIEAKAFGAWDNGQTARKGRRLSLLRKVFGLNETPLGSDLRLHFVLWSPSPPAKQKLGDEWREWRSGTADSPLHHMTLEGPRDSPFFCISAQNDAPDVTWAIRKV